MEGLEHSHLFMVERTCTYTTTRRSEADLISDLMSKGGLLDIPEQNYSYETASLHIRGVKAFLRIWRRSMIIWLLERARVATKITGRERICERSDFSNGKTVDRAKA